MFFCPRGHLFDRCYGLGSLRTSFVSGTLLSCARLVRPEAIFLFWDVQLCVEWLWAAGVAVALWVHIHFAMWKGGTLETFAPAAARRW